VIRVDRLLDPERSVLIPGACTTENRKYGVAPVQLARPEGGDPFGPPDLSHKAGGKEFFAASGAGTHAA
jgi:hypothetical protein